MPGFRGALDLAHLGERCHSRRFSLYGSITFAARWQERRPSGALALKKDNHAQHRTALLDLERSWHEDDYCHCCLDVCDASSG
jgi:hypothetical protein